MAISLYYLTKNEEFSNTFSYEVLDRNIIPLRECRHNISVNNYLVNHEINLEYKNETDKSIEAIFTFPLIFDVSVYHFEARMESGKVIKCILEEKEKSKEIYDTSLKNGKRTLLMDTEGNGLFTVKVGNLDSKTCMNVKILTCYELINTIHNTFELLLPISLTKLAESNNQYADPKSNNINPTIKSDPYKIKVSGSIKMDCDEIKVVANNGNQITFSNLNKNSLSFDMDVMGGRDIVLSIIRNSNSPFLLSEKQINPLDSSFNFTHLLNLIPTQEKVSLIHASDSSYAIVADRSGSMAEGLRMKQLKSALPIILEMLQDNSKMSIYMFNNSFIEFKNNRDILNNDCANILNDNTNILNNDNTNILNTDNEDILNKDYRNYFNKWIEEIIPFGGTEFVPVLQQAITGLVSGGRNCKNIIFLTDGCVNNSKRVLEVAILARNCGIRIFCFGIGDGCSKELLVKISQITYAEASFVTDKEDLRMKLISLVNKTRTAQQQIKIDVNTNGDYEIIGYNGTGYLYAECNNIFYIKSNDKINHVTINDTEVITPEYQDDNMLIKFVGKKIINNTKNKQTIIATSLATGVLSEYTCFVGVEEIEEKQENDKDNIVAPVKVYVPIPPVHEYQDIFDYGFEHGEKLCGTFEDLNTSKYPPCSPSTQISICSTSISTCSNAVPESAPINICKSANFSKTLDLSFKNTPADKLSPREIKKIANNLPEADELSPRSPRSPEITRAKPNSRSSMEILKEKFKLYIPKSWLSSDKNKDKKSNVAIPEIETTVTAKIEIKCTIEKLGEFTRVGDCYISREYLPLSETPLEPGDYIRVTDPLYKGIYKVISNGSQYFQWVIELIK